MNQNMKRGIAFIMALLLFCPVVFAVDEALEANNLVIEKSCPLNETLTFEKNDFTQLFGKDGKNVKGIIITTLPQSDSGKLLLSGGDISLYDTIPLSEISHLEFEPNINSEVKAVSFDFKAYSSKDFIDGEPVVSIQLNDPSAVLPEPQNFSLNVIKDIAVNGFFKTQEPSVYGDVRFVIAQAPRFGEVTLAPDGVSFIYHPDVNKTGKDSFTFYAEDSTGNISEKTATVSVNVKASKNDFYYEDLADHWAHYAALTLAQKGIITGEKIGTKSFFYPDKIVNRGDFLVMLMQTCGLCDDLPECTDTGFSDDKDIPEYLKKYVKKAVEAGIISGSPGNDGLCFNAAEALTRIQAAKMINAAAKLTDVKATMRDYSDAECVPTWAVQSVVNLASQGILKGYDDNSIRPDQLINKAQAAELLCQLLNYQESNGKEKLGVFGFIKNIFK